MLCPGAPSTLLLLHIISVSESGYDGTMAPADTLFPNLFHRRGGDRGTPAGEVIRQGIRGLSEAGSLYDSRMQVVVIISPIVRP